jgi:hypothetical protein
MGAKRLAWVLLGVCAEAAACGRAGSGAGEGSLRNAPTAGEAGGGDGDPRPPAGGTIFAQSYGDEGQQTFGGSAGDASGSIYVAGSERPVQVVELAPGRVVGPIEGTSTGAFAVKYRGSGVLEWRQPFPTTGDNFATLHAAVVQPTTGAVIFAGWLTGSISGDINAVSSTNPQFGVPAANLLLVALDTAGYVVWSRLYPSPSDVHPEQVFVTASGDIEVVGTAAGNGATVGGAPLGEIGQQLTTSAFLARFSPVGDPIWSTAVSGAFILGGAGADADGGLAIGGALSGMAVFDGHSFNAGGFNADNTVLLLAGVVLRSDPQGHLAWSRVISGPQSSAIFRATLDGAGNVPLRGQFNGVLDFGGGQTLVFGNANSLQRTELLAKLGPDGSTLWAHQFPASGFDTITGQAIAADAAGNILLAGQTAGGLSLGGAAPPLPSGASGVFVAKFDPNGNWIWDRGFAVDTSNETSSRIGLGTDGVGAVGVAGEFNNTVDFGTGPLTAPGRTTTTGSALPKVPDNVFTVKLAP